MNRILSVGVLVLLGGTAVVLAQDAGFPGCTTPMADTPQSIMDYFQKFNKPIPRQYCMDQPVEPQEAVAPEQVPLPDRPPQDQTVQEEQPQTQELEVPHDVEVPEEAPPPPPVPYQHQQPVPPQEYAPPQDEGQYDHHPVTQQPPQQMPIPPVPPMPLPQVPAYTGYYGPGGVAIAGPGFQLNFRFERRQARREMRWRRRGWRNGFTY